MGRPWARSAAADWENVFCLDTRLLLRSPAQHPESFTIWTNGESSGARTRRFARKDRAFSRDGSAEPSISNCPSVLPSR